MRDTNFWKGSAKKGFMKQVRETKREEAEHRNQGGSVMQSCGHKHGPLQVSRCEVVNGYYVVDEITMER